MKVAIVINDFMSEKPTYSTMWLVRAATNLGHEVWVMDVGGFIYEPDGSLHARARRCMGRHYESMDEMLAELKDRDQSEEHISLDDLNVLWLRNNPSDDMAEKPWATTSPLLFGQLAVSRGVLVVNDPLNLTRAINKTYFQHFPEQVRPRTFISRDVAEIRQFVLDHNDDVVIKPLQGSGGQSVFLVKEHDMTNLNQIIETIIRDGYCVVQEYLPAAARGDVRLFLMNGKPLVQDEHYAAFCRVSKSGDLRSNMHAGGESQPARIDETALSLAKAVAPKLIRDGMFLVGLDIVKDKLMEINVFSPGGLASIYGFTGVDFSYPIVCDLERKIEWKQTHRRPMRNAQLATM